MGTSKQFSVPSQVLDRQSVSGAGYRRALTGSSRSTSIVICAKVSVVAVGSEFPLPASALIGAVVSCPSAAHYLARVVLRVVADECAAAAAAPSAPMGPQPEHTLSTYRLFMSVHTSPVPHVPVTVKQPPTSRHAASQQTLPSDTHRLGGSARAIDASTGAVTVARAVRRIVPPAAHIAVVCRARYRPAHRRDRLIRLNASAQAVASSRGAVVGRTGVNSADATASPTRIRERAIVPVVAQHQAPPLPGSPVIRAVVGRSIAINLFALGVRKTVACVHRTARADAHSLQQDRSPAQFCPFNMLLVPQLSSQPSSTV